MNTKILSIRSKIILYTARFLSLKDLISYIFCNREIFKICEEYFHLRKQDIPWVINYNYDDCNIKIGWFTDYNDIDCIEKNKKNKSSTVYSGCGGEELNRLLSQYPIANIGYINCVGGKLPIILDSMNEKALSELNRANFIKRIPVRMGKLDKPCKYFNLQIYKNLTKVKGYSLYFIGSFYISGIPRNRF